MERERDWPEVLQQAHGKVGFKFMAPGFYGNPILLAQNFPRYPLTHFVAWVWG